MSVMMKKRYLVVCLLMWPFLVCAAEKKADKKAGPWKGSNAVFGASINTGNSTNKDTNTGLFVFYKRGKWKNEGSFEAQFSTSKKGMTKELYALKAQSQYHYSKRSFTYLKSDTTADRFSPFDFVTVNSAGLGHVLFNDDRLEISVQGGLGGRHSKESTSGQIDGDIIFELDGTLIWHVNENTEFQQKFENDIGQPYTFSQSTTSITTKMVGNLGMRTSVVVKRYSSIPLNSANTEKVDTTTNIALVYNFA